MSRLLRTRKYVVGGVIMVTCYFGLYLLNAAFGGYNPYYTSGGRNRINGALLRHDCIMWQPKFGCYYNQYRNDFIGIVFYPLLQCDHAFVHKTHAVCDENFSRWWANLTVTDIHPKYRSDYAKWTIIWAKYTPDLEAAKARGDTADAKGIRDIIRKEVNEAVTNK